MPTYDKVAMAVARKTIYIWDVMTHADSENMNSTHVRYNPHIFTESFALKVRDATNRKKRITHYMSLARWRKSKRI